MDLKNKKFEPLYLFLALLAYGAVFLPVLTDWVSFAVDEGFTSYGAQRLREGQWPHRDFFFLWSPGILVWHAWLQELGFSWIGERASALFFSSITPAILLLLVQEWGIRFSHRLLFSFLVIAWGFSLWNIPYASWYAVPLGLLAIWAQPRSALAAGLLWGLSFWFKQNIGMLGCAGALLVLAGAREWKTLGKLAVSFSLALFLPFLFIFLKTGEPGLTAALRQIFLFPISYPHLMGTSPEREMIAPALVTIGLWLLSLFTLRPDLEPGMPRLMRTALLFFLAYNIYAKFSQFLLGWFILVSLGAWVIAGVMGAADLPREERRKFFGFFLPAAGICLQVFPRLDFQHVLFIFPISLVLLQWSTERLQLRYQWLRSGMIYLPVALLGLGGFYFQMRGNYLRWEGQRDRLGMISYGAGQRLNDEMHSVITYLHDRGLKTGDPILVLPNATSFYNWSGFHNPTPHDQFFPGYVKAFGAEPAEVLHKYEAAGGKFLVVQRYSGLEKNEPGIDAEIRGRYRLLKDFREHFSVWEQKSP